MHMKIKDSLYKAIQTFESPKPEEVGRNAKETGRGAPEGDHVTLSEHARDLARTLKAASEADDVRTEQVAELKERVQSGTYQTDSREIARKLLQDEIDLFT
jgi:negative regulator of flagellin synthesis FlgM